MAAISQLESGRRRAVKTPPDGLEAADVRVMGQVVLGALLFVGLLALLAELAGWRELARHYRANRPMTGQSFWFRSARMGLMGIGGALIFNGEREGVGLRALFPFSVFQPALLLPWSQLSAESRRGIFPEVTLRPLACPDLSLTLSGRLFDRVLLAAGRSLTDLATPATAPASREVGRRTTSA